MEKAKKQSSCKRAKTSKTTRNGNGIEDCKSLIDILRHMSIARDTMKKSGNVTTAAIIEKYAEQICKIHNRQAVFNDALKRIMKDLQNKLDRTDAIVSVLASYLESAVTVPYSFDETNHLEELVREIGRHM